MDLKYNNNILLHNIQYANANNSVNLLGINEEEGTIEKVPIEVDENNNSSLRDWHIYVFDFAQFVADGHDIGITLYGFDDIGEYLYPESNAISIQELFELPTEELERYKINIIVKVLGLQDEIYPAWYCPIGSEYYNNYYAGFVDTSWGEPAYDPDRQLVYSFYVLNLAVAMDSSYPSISFILLRNDYDNNGEQIIISSFKIFDEGGGAI